MSIDILVVSMNMEIFPVLNLRSDIKFFQLNLIRLILPFYGGLDSITLVTMILIAYQSGRKSYVNYLQ